MSMPMNSRFRLLAPAALAALSTVACGGGHTDETAAERGTPLRVSVAQVTRAGLADRFEVGGTVVAREHATLVSRLMAPVARVHVSAGDRVRRGQVLVTLDSADLTAHASSARAAADAAAQGGAAARAEHEAARAALALAKASYDRVATLHERKSATAHELDQATAALRAAEARVSGAGARVQEAESGLSAARAAGSAATATAAFTRILAPFSGVVIERLVEPGNMATPGQPLLRVESTDRYRLEVRLDDARLGTARQGDDVPVVLDGSSGTTEVDGTIAEISRAVDSGTRSSLVKIDLPPGTSVRTGTYGRARVAGAAADSLMVPAGAVVTRGQVKSVFVVEGDAARLRLVNVGPAEGDRVPVLAGLTEGERVVVAPPPGLRDGTRVAASGPAPARPAATEGR